MKQNRLTYVINCFKFDFLGLVIAVCSGSTFEKKLAVEVAKSEFFTCGVAASNKVKIQFKLS